MTRVTTNKTNELGSRKYFHKSVKECSLHNFTVEIPHRKSGNAKMKDLLASFTQCSDWDWDSWSRHNRRVICERNSYQNTCTSKGIRWRFLIIWNFEAGKLVVWGIPTHFHSISRAVWSLDEWKVENQLKSNEFSCSWKTQQMKFLYSKQRKCEMKQNQIENVLNFWKITRTRARVKQ